MPTPASQPHFGKLLSRARRDREWSQAKLSRDARVSIPSIQRYEREAVYAGEPEKLSDIIRAMHRFERFSPSELDALAQPLGQLRPMYLPDAEMFPAASEGLGDIVLDDLMRRLLRAQSRDYVIAALETLLVTAAMPPVGVAQPEGKLKKVLLSEKNKGDHVEQIFKDVEVFPNKPSSAHKDEAAAPPSAPKRRTR